MSKKITTATPLTEKYNKEQGCNHENKKADCKGRQVKNDKKTARRGWHANTMLAVDVKTLLHSDSVMRPGREYQGVLRRDVQVDEFRWDEHLTFTETLPWTAKRNPRVYRGRFITVTRRQDGSLRLNFRPVAMDGGFSVERYAFGVYREIGQALVGLVGENDVRSKM